MPWIKRLIKPLWHRYIKACQAAPWLALPMPNGLAAAGSVWCHPTFFRHAWSRDDAGVFGALLAMLQPGDTFFDVGANIGQTAIIGSRAVGSTGQMVSFEPSPANVKMMEYHLRWNRIRNVRVESVCIGNSIGTADFALMRDGLHSSNSLVFPQGTVAAPDSFADYVCLPQETLVPSSL